MKLKSIYTPKDKKFRIPRKLKKQYRSKNSLAASLMMRPDLISSIYSFDIGSRGYTSQGCEIVGVGYEDAEGKLLYYDRGTMKIEDFNKTL